MTKGKFISHTSSVAPPWSRIWPKAWWKADKWLFLAKRITATATACLNTEAFPITLLKRPWRIEHLLLNSSTIFFASTLHKLSPETWRRIDLLFSLQMFLDSLTANSVTKRHRSFLWEAIEKIFLAIVLHLSPLSMDLRTPFHCPFTIPDLTPCDLPRYEIYEILF